MKAQLPIKFVTWNIDTNLIRVDEGPARETHPQWRVASRMEMIKKELKDINPDILHLQELRNLINTHSETVDSETPLKNYLEESGYKVSVTPYNHTGGNVFKYITAWKADRFENTDSKQLYFTKTPNNPTLRPDTKGKTPEEIKEIEAVIKENNHGEFYERCAALTYLKDLKTSDEIVTFNIHCAIPVRHRLESSKLLVNFVKEEVQNNNNLKVIISGDFNSYPKTVGPEQIKTINDALLDDAPLLLEASDKLFLPNGTPMPINNTFISFPYDVFTCDPNSPNKDKINNAVTSFPSFEPAERKKVINKAFEELGDACSGQLDHIFTRNFSKIGECIVNARPQFAPPPEVYDEKHVKAYILAHVDDGPAFASDHQPLVTELLGQ